MSRLELCGIIEARMRETFELLRDEMDRSGHGMLPAGIILTGGASQQAGEVARYESAPGGGVFGRLRDAVRSVFP